MPIDIRHDQEKKILYVTIRDQICQNEFADTLERITNSDNYPPDVAILWDARSVNMPVADKQFVSNLVEIRKRYPERKKSKIAIIAPSDFTFGMSRMYEMLSGGLPKNIMVFRDFMKGEQWLQDR